MFLQRARMIKTTSLLYIISMKILLFSDSHSNITVLEKLKHHLEINNYDLAICAGDFTNSWQNDLEYVQNLIKAFREKKITFFAVPGNNDKQDVYDLLVKNEINLHLQMRRFRSYEFFGIKKPKNMPLVHIFGHLHKQSSPQITNDCLFVGVPPMISNKILTLTLPGRSVNLARI